MTKTKVISTKENELIKKYQYDKIWVNYRFKSLPDGRQTKIPYNPHTNTLASSTDPKTWSTYEQAITVSERVGIIFSPFKKLIGIDIDHCVNKETREIEHELKEQIEALVVNANTYCEISPSGTGLHLFIAITEAFDLLANRHTPYEIYNSGRYFTVTQDTFTLNKVSYNKPVKELTTHEAIKLLETIGYPWKQIEETKSFIVEKTEAPSLTDQELLTKIFNSKNGTKVQSVYNMTGETGLSSEDLSLCSTLAFWTQKNHDQIERIWLNSPIGQRKKTQERKDYRDRTIEQAIKGCNDVYSSDPKSTQIVKKTIEKESPELDLLFTLNKDGGKIFVLNTENISRVLSHHPKFKGRIRYDKFKNTLEYDKHGIGRWKPFESSDEIYVQTQISIIFPCFIKVSKNMVQDAMVNIAKANEIDSAIDYIKSLKWDGESRISNWLSNTYGAPDDEYHQAVGSNWLKGLIKRVTSEGCKFDYVLVLEGEQGTKKSTSLSVLGEMENNYNWHVETSMSTDNKDFFMQFQGKAIIEFSEGDTLSRTEVKKMKAIITTQVDKYRPPYERISQDFPRRCVFAMTTNETEYLKDDTGNRRWLPVKVELQEANIDWLRNNRDQLFAEAYHRVYHLKETIYEFPLDATNQQQNSRRIRDVNVEAVIDWYENLTENEKIQGVNAKDVYDKVIAGGVYAKPFDRFEEMKISGILKADLMLEKRRSRVVGGSQKIRWFRRDLTIQEELTGLDLETPEEDIYAGFE